MTRVDEFDRFYELTRRQVLAVVYAMCADRENARRATRLAYRSVWRSWHRKGSREASEIVHAEAWRHTGLGRAAPVLRRRRERGADVDLLAALGDLDHPTRHLVCLMTIADMDLDEAARHVEVDEERALEMASRGFSRLEGLLETTIENVVDRLHTLRQVTDNLELPEPSRIRSIATFERRRNALLMVSAAVASTVVAGLLVTQGPANTEVAVPQREQLGNESSDIKLDAHRMTEDDLLSVAQVSALNPEADWVIDGTDLDLNNTTPYATCPTRRFADKDPLRVFVRAYSDGEGDRVAQSIEVSRSASRSREAYAELVSFYADCEHPRVRLVDSWRVERPFGDFTILRLQSHREPERFITVGFAQSGPLTSTLVHEREGEERSDVEVFANILNESITRVCTITGGDCGGDYSVVRSTPPPAGEFPGFLGIVDLPPIAEIDRVWSASAPQELGEANPAATPCEQPEFTGSKVVSAESRIYTIPEAEELPEGFAIAQTVGQFIDRKAAEEFARDVVAAIEECTKGDVPVELDQVKELDRNDQIGATWRIAFQTSEDSTVSYRMGIIQRGAAVSQNLFPPAGRYSLSAEAFTSLTQRSASRLSHLDQAN